MLEFFKVNNLVTVIISSNGVESFRKALSRPLPGFLVSPIKAISSNHVDLPFPD
jgi:hypothetical protein